MCKASLRRYQVCPALVGVLALASGCAPAGQHVFLAPSDQTVSIRTEASMNGQDQRIVVENHSTVPIVVTSLHLTDCENIKNRCEVTRLNIPVAAGQTRHIATVQPQYPERAYNFRYSWTWGAKGTTPTLPGQ